MNDNKLKELFAGYEPDIQSDAMFMARLERNLRAVEFIKKTLMTAKRHNRAAMTIACIIGFIAGGLFISVMPHVVQWLNSQSFMNLSAMLKPEQMTVALTYCLGCVGTVALTFASYDIALGLSERSKMLYSQK